MSPSDEDAAREIINDQLHDTGWEKLGDHIAYDELDRIHGTGYIEELGTDTGPADYGLILDGDLVSIIEAKHSGENAAGHFQQAERYARSVSGPYELGDKYGVPIVFVSTGRETHIYDFRQAALSSRPIFTVHTPDGLKRLITRDYESSQEWLADNPATEFDPDLWVHQAECIDAVEENLRERERRMLIKMATGSGKTRTAQAITYRLLESGFADNVLFIPDTRKLADDAYTSFSGYEPTGADSQFSDKYRIVNLEEDEKSRLNRGEVVITTLQKMYYLLESDEVDFHPGDFDLIITDECHRSIYQNEGYGGVLQKFDAVEIGMTATPTQRTIARFGNNLVYEYGYEQAVSDDHIVPFQMYELETRITMSGVRDTDTGEYYPPDSLGSEVLVPDTHRKVGQELRDRMETDNELTLVFARNDNHATQIVQDLRETVFSDKPDTYIQKITYKADRPSDTLNRFSDPYDPSPAIAVTVQMVSTGVDIRPLKNIVLLNPVKSPVQFNQMMGRGSRVYDKKTHFNIYDCVGAFDYFEGTPPFGTLEYDHPASAEGSTETSGDSDSEEGPIIVNVPDEVLRSEPVFPTETGERLTADEFRRAFRRDVQCKAHQILNVLTNTPDIESANQELLEILQGESQYYVPVFIEKAYEPVTENGDHLLLDYVNEALTGRLSTFEQRKAHARSQLEKRFDLTDVERQYLELITATSEPVNGITKNDFYDPPLSQIGGWKRAEDSFETLSPVEMINKHRAEMSNLIGEIEVDTQPSEDYNEESS